VSDTEDSVGSEGVETRLRNARRWCGWSIFDALHILMGVEVLFKVFPFVVVSNVLVASMRFEFGLIF
jgi:hypothetical protein